MSDIGERFRKYVDLDTGPEDMIYATSLYGAREVAARVAESLAYDNTDGPR